MCRSAKKLKTLIEFPYIVDVKVHVLSFNMNLVSSPQCVPRPSYPFRGKLGVFEKDRPPTKIKSLIEVPYVANLKVQVVSFNMILISSPQRVPRRCCPFRGKIGRSGKWSSNEKAKIADRGSLCSEPESTGSKFEYEPYLFSVACSQTELIMTAEAGGGR